MVMCMTQRPWLNAVMLTVAQVVQDLRGEPAYDSVTADSVRRWIRTGRLPATKIFNGEYRINPVAVRAIKDGQDPHEALRLIAETEQTTT
jgi:hypothetical protein